MPKTVISHSNDAEKLLKNWEKKIVKQNNMKYLFFVLKRERFRKFF